MKQLVIYNEQRIPTMINEPHADTMLGWLDQLDGERITAISIITLVGRMWVGTRGDKLILTFSDDHSKVIRRNEIVSRQIATETALFFLESEGLPAGRAAVPTASRIDRRSTLLDLMPMLTVS